MSHLDPGQKAKKSPACRRCSTFKAGPGPDGICSNCLADAARLEHGARERNDTVHSSRGLFGVGAERRRQLQQRSRAWGTPEGQVANTNLVPIDTTPTLPDSTPIDMVDGVVDGGGRL